MSFTTPQTLSITVSAADANRVQACSQALVYPSIKATVVTQQVVRELLHPDRSELKS